MEVLEEVLVSGKQRSTWRPSAQNVVWVRWEGKPR